MNKLQNRGGKVNNNNKLTIVVSCRQLLRGEGGNKLSFPLWTDKERGQL